MAMTWKKAGPGRPPRVSDPEIAEIRRRHIELGVPLKVLSAQTGLSADTLAKIMTGKRRASAGGPVRAPLAPGELQKMPPEIKAAIVAELAAGRKNIAVARKFGVSAGYVSKLSGKVRDERRQRRR